MASHQCKPASADVKAEEIKTTPVKSTPTKSGSKVVVKKTAKKTDSK